MRMLIVTVTVITATTVIRIEIIGLSFPPGLEIPRSANTGRGSSGTSHALLCANFENIPFDLHPFGKPHMELVGEAPENIKRFHNDDHRGCASGRARRRVGPFVSDKSDRISRR